MPTADATVAASKPDPAVARAARVFDVLAARLAPLGLPLAHVAPGGAIARSTDASAFDRAFASAPLVASTKHTAPQVDRLDDGTWLVQAHTRLSRRVGWYATVMRGGYAGDVNAVGPDGAKTTVPASVAQRAALFHAAVHDLGKVDADSITLEQFADKLAQSYEEVKLLSRLAHEMNSSGDPAGVVGRLCDDLAALMPFGFVGVAFTSDARVHEALRGRLFLAQGTRLSNADAGAATRGMLDRLIANRDAKVLRPGDDSLAAPHGSELIGHPIDHDGNVVAALVTGEKAGDVIEREISSFELQILGAAAENLGTYHQNVCRFAEQQAMFRGTLGAMIAALDAKDPYTAGHSERVGLLARQMATALGLDGQTARRYEIAGLVHDVGKIGVPEAVLCKTGKLTEAEFALIKLHPEIGHRILKDIPAMQYVLPGVLHHHEHWNGKGYPHGIAADAIPLQARVLALADTFDAMSSNRSYRSALSRDRVLAELVRCAGTQFDPALVPTFVAIDFGEFDRLLRQHAQSTPALRAAA
jgi:HD-GYP domain-containing protein (c-di-GMP phosphodiesterase class II)